MKVLKSNLYAFKLLGICPIDKVNNTLKQLMHYLVSLTFGVSFVIGIVASIMYFYSNIKTDVNKSLFTIFQVFSLVLALGVLVSLHVNRRTVSAIFINLQNVYDQSKLKLKKIIFRN